MARTFLTSGQTAGVAPGTVVTELFGTNANETVNIITVLGVGADVVFDASFNRGGDVINIDQPASSYTAQLVGGSRLVLTGTNGSVIDIPAGATGVVVNFSDADGRVLRFDGPLLKLGDQTITTTASAVLEGDGPVLPPQDEIFLTSSSDIGGVYNGTSGADFFYAPIVQNPALGGVSNSLSSGDRVIGGAGSDRLYAEIVPEFFTGTPAVIDIQPTIRSVERIEFEARDLGTFSGSKDSYINYASSSSSQAIYVDAKKIADVVRIGSAYSDGDLVIENLTTLTTAGVARNTDSVTITMDHTDNFNSDGDASDLQVYFDDDYLLAGQSRTTSQANYFLLDEDSDDYINEPLLNIERNGITLTIDGTPVVIRVSNTAAGVPDNYEAYAQALRNDIANQIATGTTILQGITVVVDPNNTEDTFNDDGVNVIIPAISLIDAQGREIIPTGFVTPADATGSFDIYGTFNNDPSETFDDAITVNIELNKVGRNGEGGDLIVGGKNGDKGIEVFNVSVQGVGVDDPSGEVAKPSSLGTLASTGNALAEVYISTDPAFVDGDTFASLEIRDGFGDAWNSYDNPANPDGSSSLRPNDLRLVDADEFLGDLALGTNYSIVNLDTLLARGGGNVTFYGDYNGAELAQPYVVSTGEGEDFIELEFDGDALDFRQSSVTVSTGGGDDEVNLFFDPDGAGNTGSDVPDILNQAVLANVSVDTGSGNDIVRLLAPTAGNAIIDAGSGNDEIYTTHTDYNTSVDQRDAWLFNFDTAANAAPSVNDPTDDVAGKPLSLAYLSGATITVAFSGAGTGSAADGGGVMAYGDADSVSGPFINGYESSVAITSLINGNNHFGDQRDINAAIIKAIEGSPVLSKLLSVSEGPNNTLIVNSLTGGNFNPGDLEVTIALQPYSSTNYGSSVLTEARRLAGDSSLTLTDLWGSQTPAVTDAYDNGPDAAPFADVTNTWYRGLGVDQAYESYNGGFVDDLETDTIINGGAGDDLIVLSTDYTGFLPGVTDTFTVGPFNQFYNGASNETIVLEDVFGNDTVMNFTTALGNATTTGSGPTLQGLYEDGLDFLDFSDYLTSLQDESVNTIPDSPNSPVSNELIPVTLDYNIVADPTVLQQANEVTIVRLTGTSTQSFANLTSTVIQNLFNTDLAINDYGDFDATDFNAFDEYTANVPNGTDQLIGGAGSAKGIIMVENAANLGQYKVFELSWNGNDSADVDSAANGIVTATQIGTLDFGTSLTGIEEINLVGTLEYGQLLVDGFGPFTPVI